MISTTSILFFKAQINQNMIRFYPVYNISSKSCSFLDFFISNKLFSIKLITIEYQQNKVLYFHFQNTLLKALFLQLLNCN